MFSLQIVKIPSLKSNNTMMQKKVRCNFLFVFTLLLIAFFSCKSDQNTQGTSNNTTVRVRFQTDLTTLNPYLYRTSYEAHVFDLMYQYPLQFDLATLNLSPQLAKSMPRVEDITEGEYAGGRAFYFEFFEEAVWDDGTPITGYDYEFTMKAIFNPQMKTQRFAAYIDYIREIKVDETNPKNFTIYTSRPYVIDKEAVSNFIVLPKHLYDPEGLMTDFSLKDLTDPEKAAALADSDDRLAKFAENYEDPKYSREVFHGSGPYQLVEWVDGQVIALEKKDNWWGNDLGTKNPALVANPDRIEFKPIKDNAAAMTALQDGEIDIMSEVDSKDFLEAQQKDSLKTAFDFYTPTRLGFFYTAMNTDDPKLSDKRVRRAIALCYDVEEIIKSTYEGLGERVLGPFAPTQPYFNKDLKLLEQDIVQSKTLLAEAGWTDSNNNGIVDKTIDGELTELSIEFLYSPNVPFQVNMSSLVKEAAKQAGIDIQRVSIDSRELGKKLRQKDYEMAGRGAGANPIPDDPKQMWHCDSARPGGSNYSNLCLEELDKMIDEVRITSDMVKRDELYKQIQAIIYEEQPFVFLFSPKNKIIIDKKFKAPVISKFKLGVSIPHLHQ